MYVILVYDITTDEEGVKVLPKVFRECKKFLIHIQKSVFEGELTDSQLLKLKMNLGKLIRKDRDSVIMFISRDQKWLKKDFIGISNPNPFNFI